VLIKPKTIHRFFWIIGYLIPIFLGGSYLLANSLKAKLIESLNQSLQVQVRVGNIQFSGIESFPFIGLDLNTVRVDESFPAYQNNLLEAGSIHVKVNPFNLLGSQKELHRLIIRQATFRIYQGVKGNSNFEIFKSKETSQTQLSLSFRKIQLQNCRIIYQNEDELLSFNVLAYNITAKGDFNSERFTIESEFSGLFDHVRQGEDRYLIGKHAHAELSVEVDNSIGAYHIKSADLGVEELNVHAQGDILMIKGIPDFDLELHADRNQIQGLLAILPNATRFKFKNIESTGAINLEATVKGPLSELKWPHVNANFDLENVTLYNRATQLEIQNINLKANLTNPSNTSELRIVGDLIQASVKESNLKTEFVYQSSENTLQLNPLKAHIRFQDLTQILPENNGSIQGTLEFNGSIVANLHKLEDPQLIGDITVSNFNYSSNDMAQIKQAGLSGRLSGNNIDKLRIDAVVGEDELLLEGTVENYTGFWNQDRAYLKGTLTGQSLHLDQFIDTSSTENESALPELDLGMDVLLKANLGKFTWANLDVINLRTDFVWEKDVIRISRAQFGAWEGNHKLDLDFGVEDEYYRMVSNSESKEFELKALFKQFENFDQSEITHEHIAGKSTMKLDLSMLFDKDFKIVDREVQSRADLLIKNGRLSQYKPLEKLSLFVELDELKEIKFDELNNTIEIRHGVMYLPETVLSNSALNLGISGTHTLQNQMDYHLSIQVSELLAKKSKWLQKKHEKKLEEGRDGGLTAYVLMTGTPDNLRFKYDRKAASKEFQKKFKEESKSFFQQIKRDIKGETTEGEDKKKVKWDE